MKKLLTGLMFVVLSVMAILAQADFNYPFTSPTYVPMGQTPPVTLATGASTSNVFTLNNFGTTVLRISGTCTSLSFGVQATNDVGTATNWSTINAYPYPALGTAAPTVDLDGVLTATGIYKFNTVGFTKVRLNITALAGTTCVAQFTAGDNGFNGTTW